MRGLATEATWLATHVAFYPVGVLSRRAPQPIDRYSLAGMPPLHRGLLVADVEAAGTPILLLHGLIDNRSIFTRLHRLLRRRGFGRVTSVNLQMYSSDVESAAARLARCVESVCQQTGYPRLHVVAHSLGGLVARYYIQRLGGDARIHTLITLGTPHEGTRLAHMLPQAVPYRLVAQLRPDSELIVTLAEPAPGCRTRFVCFGGELDTVVRPPASALLHHPDLRVRNVMMPGLGHHALPFDSRVVHEVATTLAYLETAEDPPDVPAGKRVVRTRE